MIVPENKKLLYLLNGVDGWKPHHTKVRYFLSIFPERLICVEFGIKFILNINRKRTTYNPDFYCPIQRMFIEVVTSKPNISEQGPKWYRTLKEEFPLEIYWWQGQNITKKFMRYPHIPSKVIP